MSSDVLVIGAGVSGLTTAICLVEAGHDVAVHTDRPPAHTTSAVAGAMIATVGGGDPGPMARGAASQAEMATLAGRPDTGVRNYGHGGNGVTLSWGCAREVLALIAG